MAIVKTDNLNNLRKAHSNESIPSPSFDVRKSRSTDIRKTVTMKIRNKPSSDLRKSKTIFNLPSVSSDSIENSIS